MFKGILQLLKGTIYQGLEIFEMDGNLQCALLKLKRKKGELLLLDASIFNSLSELVSHVDKKKALLLNINTAKVLDKQVSDAAPKIPEQWVKQAFPNLDLEQFYYQILDSSGLRMVSIAKKKTIDDLLSRLNDAGIGPTTISIGISGLKNSLPFLEAPIRGSNFMINANEQGELEVSPLSHMQATETNIQGLRLPATHLSCFSQILGYLSPSDIPSNMEGLNSDLDNHFKNQRFYQLGLQLGLGIILAILLLNFMVFSHYRSQAMTSDGAIDPEQQAQMLLRVRERVSEKENKLWTLQGSSNTRTTFYLDRIGAGIPNSILLDELAYQPLTRPIRPDKPITMESDHIRITGETNNKGEFAQWTAQIENMEWVKSVEIERYEYTSSSLDRFTVKIVCDAIGY